jgi:hypothetical protein
MKIHVNKTTANIGSRTMRVSEGSQAQWHACGGITSGQGRATHSRTVSSRKRYAQAKNNRQLRFNFDKKIRLWY